MSDALSALSCQQVSCSFEDTIKICFNSPLHQTQKDLIFHTAQSLKPWRKGPFCIDELFIDSEWRSFLKFNLISSYVDFNYKDIADIGCNNGYYLFRILKHSPKSLTGFEPYSLFKSQFDFLNYFIQSSICYERLGIEHLASYAKKFDLILCMGVLYHRSDPIASLKQLAKALNPQGEVILDTLILDCQEEIALCPVKSYAKMSNTYFIPSMSALKGWCERAGFQEVKLLAQVPTTTEEQRKTQWIDSMSLEHFLNPCDHTKTIEGYPAPLRGYFKLKRK